MDKWDAAAAKAWQAILEKVRYLNEKEGVTLEAIAQRLGIKNRGSVSLWLSGDRKAENTSFPNMLRYLENLGLDYWDYFPAQATIRRTGSRAPLEAVLGKRLPKIPVVGNTGAGAPVELFSLEPEAVIEVLPQYDVPGVVALLVDGDSMEPTVRKGAYVGVVPFDGTISEGGIYLVHIPPFGRTIKRLRISSSGGISLHSDNRAYEPIQLENEGYENTICGKVVWIWQLC